MDLAELKLLCVCVFGMSQILRKFLEMAGHWWVLSIKKDFPELVECEEAFEVFGLDLVLDSLAESELAECLEEPDGLFSVLLVGDLRDA